MGGKCILLSSSDSGEGLLVGRLLPLGSDGRVASLKAEVSAEPSTFGVSCTGFNADGAGGGVVTVAVVGMVRIVPVFIIYLLIRKDSFRAAINFA